MPYPLSHGLGKGWVAASAFPIVAAATGPKLTFPAPAGQNFLYKMDVDQITGTDGARITSYTDPASGIAATAPGGTGPVFKPASMNGHNALRFASVHAERLSIGIPNALKLTTGYTVFMVVSKITGATSTASAFGSDAANAANVNLNMYTSGGMGNNFWYAGDAAADMHTLAYSGDLSSTSGRYYRDGGLAQAGVKTLGQSTLDLLIGSIASSANGFTSPFGGDVLYLAIVDKAWNPAEMLQAHFWACTRFGKALPIAGRTYFPVFDGDSLTYGTGVAGAAGREESYPGQLAIQRSWPIGSFANVGKPSSTILGTNQMIEKAPTDVDLFADTTGLPVVLVADEWHNQGQTGGVTASGVTIADNNRLYAQYRKASGKFAKILGMTSTSSTREGAARDGFNQSLIDNKGDFDLMASLHTDATIGVNGSNLNTTYFAGDQVHMIKAGYTKKKDVASALLTAAGYTT